MNGHRSPEFAAVLITRIIWGVLLPRDKFVTHSLRVSLNLALIQGHIFKAHINNKI